MPIYADFQMQVWPRDNVRGRVSTSVDGRYWVAMREGDNLDFAKILIVGATLDETTRIVDAINAAIEGAKSRAAADAEPMAQAAE